MSMELKSLTYKELIELEKSVARAKIIAQAQAEQEIRQTCLDIIKKSGFTIAELFGKPKRKKAAKLN